MIPTDVMLLLRGWAEGERRVRVLLRSGSVDFSAYCRFARTNEVWLDLAIGDDPLNVFRIRSAEWVFDFKDAPMDDKALADLGEIESTIVGVSRLDSNATVCFFLMEESD